ncbi:MAG: hypothetical protein AAB668_01375 [Patescibacteria group bacterium]
MKIRSGSTGECRSEPDTERIRVSSNPICVHLMLLKKRAKSKEQLEKKTGLASAKPVNF